MTTDISEIYKPVHLDINKIALISCDLYEARFPDIYNRYTPYQKAHTYEDFKYHVKYLQESLAVSDPAIFVDYVRWAQVLLTSLNLPQDCLSSSLEVFKESLRQELSSELYINSDVYISESIRALDSAPTEIPSFIEPGNYLASTAQEYLSALLVADRNTAKTIILDSLQKGIAITDIYLFVFQPVQREVGRLWQMQKISVAQEHYVTGATQMMLAQMYLQFMSESKQRKRRGKKLVAACVSEELHEMGMRMVTDFFEMDGWDTYYIGANTPMESIVSAIRDQHADVVALSSTMSFHLPYIERQIQTIRSSLDIEKVKIIVGGYPFNLIHDLWKKIGADAYAETAPDAVALANRMTAK